MRAFAASGRAFLMGLVLVSGAAPAVAQTDWFFTPFAGGTFASSTALPDLEEGTSTSQLIVGGAAGLWSSGVFGAEADFAYAPRFFERDNQAGLFTSSNVATFSMNLVVAAPVSVTRESLRPYVTGGLGWMHASIEEGSGLFPEFFGRARNSTGINYGGGAIGFLTPRTGLRFEVRQFKSLERDADQFTGERMSLLSFWRATVGVVIRR